MLERAEDFHRRGVAITHCDRRKPRGRHSTNTCDWRAGIRWRRRGRLPVIAGMRGGTCKARAWASPASIPSATYIPILIGPTTFLGNVRETPFSEIWEKSADPLLRGLRDRLPLLKGRCANCRWKQACGGNLRVRAEEFFGDPWMADPACYLTNKEISKEITEQVEAMEDDVLLEEQAA